MQRKLKILCLHGYRQNLDKFRSQTGGLRKILKNQAEFIFVSAPHILANEEGNQRSWWFTRGNSFSSKDDADDDVGFEESLQLIKNAFAETGPFDGLLGFSQGGAFAAILASLAQSKSLAIDFRFVIIVSGFKSKCSKHQQYYIQKINLPSLHVIGETDQVIDKQLSKDLAEVFTNPVIIHHGGGHYVPGVSSLKQKYLDFIMTIMNDAGIQVS